MFSKPAQTCSHFVWTESYNKPTVITNHFVSKGNILPWKQRESSAVCNKRRLKWRSQKQKQKNLREEEKKL